MNHKCLSFPLWLSWHHESEIEHYYDLIQNLLKACCLGPQGSAFEVYMICNFLGKSSMERMNADVFLAGLEKAFRYIYIRHSMLRRKVSSKPATIKTFKSN